MKLHTNLDARDLPILGADLIADRRLRFSWPRSQYRLRPAFLDETPTPIGSIVGLCMSSPTS